MIAVDDQLLTTNLQAMGEYRIKALQTQEDRSRFAHNLLRDISALEAMLREGLFERHVQRIGAEQEVCLIGPDFGPAMTGPEILSEITETAYTSELARYNLEINLAPQLLQSDCIGHMHRDLERLLAYGQSVADRWDSRIFLTGILPTIEQRHLRAENMTPVQRYQQLSEKMLAIRGEAFKIRLEGVDELFATLDTVLFEACNTSFQLHLQIEPQDFIASYNWAQLIAGPVLAIATNSPLLLGRELWMETRIALFKQSLDTRNPRHQLRDKTPRVNFGNSWARGSVADIFKDNIARFPLLLGEEHAGEDALETLHTGRIPRLQALRIHNGTTYAWNRPCYGVGDNGQAHLRIECRYLPAGPGVLDEMANFAFWIGLMKGMPPAYQNISDTMDFRLAKANFIRAARTGMATTLEWDGRLWSAPKLAAEVLLPIAEAGLRQAGIAPVAISRYLGVIEDRCLRQQDGSRWMVNNFRQLQQRYGRGMATVLLTEAMVVQQAGGLPVHQWDDVRTARTYPRPFTAIRAQDVMSTDLLTVKEEDPVALSERIMRWRNIRHLPVENNSGEVVGLLSRSRIEAWSATGQDPFCMSRDVMALDPVCAGPDAKLTELRHQMQYLQIGCIPIVVDKHLVGMITDTDIRRLEGQTSSGDVENATELQIL